TSASVALAFNALSSDYSSVVSQVKTVENSKDLRVLAGARTGFVVGKPAVRIKNLTGRSAQDRRGSSRPTLNRAPSPKVGYYEKKGCHVGGNIGQALGGAFGAAAGEAAGNALGTAVAGRVGSRVGSITGSAAGSAAGSEGGKRAGSWIGGHVGRQIDNSARRIHPGAK
ncbi:hypothetical protein AeMF1_019349, partial [Aphanomyces euteiches]